VRLRINQPTQRPSDIAIVNMHQVLWNDVTLKGTIDGSSSIDNMAVISGRSELPFGKGDRSNMLSPLHLVLQCVSERVTAKP
jgi:hypothetical protein